ncbi:carboxymethylenebutenolidase [Paroceanicella profunda]|uniref:Carboxymethylenebutenolidase n=2 Tax=Paroceanicella profunda TaxID=2579971 RepID=A0A5B8G321_9RHOB|nr:carboxymethylenebutenolidase [Paroceanicella profunda]
MLLAGPMSAAEFTSPDIPGRVELHTIASSTLSDAEFLGKMPGVPVTVAGELRLPAGKGPFPAVVLMHGSSGIGANIEPWVRQYIAMGVATFVIDSVTGRGVRGLGDKQASVGRLNYITDIYGALDLLSQDDRIDPERIALQGFSRGGQAALYATVTRFNALWNPGSGHFASFVAFYPNCLTEYMEDTAVADVPIRIFHAAQDDYNPPATCETYVQRLKAAGADVEMTVYPNARHGFDYPTKEAVTFDLATAQTARNCKMRETEAGVITNLDTGKPFSYADACVDLGPHVGSDPEATQQAYTAVIAHMRTVFGL